MTRAAAVACALALGSCGDNLHEFEPWILEPLAAEDGFFVRTPEFEVPPGEEIQDCYFFQVPAGADVSVDRFMLALNPGSHHMNVFRVGMLRSLKPEDGAAIDLGGVMGTVIRGGECWKAPNWFGWPLVVNSQQSTPGEPFLDWKLPAGVSSRFAAGEWLMLQIHYVNAATQETPFRGRGGANFYRSKDGDTMELGTLFATQQSIRICRSQPTVSYSGTCALRDGAHRVAAVNGHFHSRGERFSVFAWDGQSVTQPPDDMRFYSSTQWAEPDMALGLDVPLPTGGGIWWRCDFQWREPAEGCAAVDERDPRQEGDCCYTFGPIVETSEHCNVFLYYYPKSEDVMCL